MRLKILGTVAVAGALALAGAPAHAAPSGGAYTCTGGDIPSGSYASITVAGMCDVPANAVVTVTGNINVAAGAMLDAQSAPSTITVGHNVTGAAGSLVGLGCTAAHGGCSGPGPEGEAGPYFPQQSTVMIKGNVTLDGVYDAALNGITVMGNVTSTGGGAGLVLPPTGPFIPFSVKDDTIHGNLTVSDLTTSWFGVIRSSIGGNVTLTNIQVADPDGNEIVHNAIGRNITCSGMNHPQFGDAVDGAPPSYQYSTVGGKALGQCAFVVAP